MAGSAGFDTAGAQETVDRSVSKIAGIAAGLVVLNVALMLGLSYTPAAALGAALFSNFLVGIAVFVLTVGGGYWLATTGIEKGNLPLAGAGVGLTQVGYGLLGAAILASVGSALRVPALGITAVITGLLTAVIAVVVFNVDHSFQRWQLYSYGLFGVGLVLGVGAYFLAPAFVVVASVFFFLGFVADLTYEIWALKESRYASALRNAIGIYIAVMGVFIHILQLVLQILSVLDY